MQVMHREVLNPWYLSLSFSSLFLLYYLIILFIVILLLLAHLEHLVNPRLVLSSIKHPQLSIQDPLL